MESYIDYNYYHNTYGGTVVPQNEFNKISLVASQEVRTRIMNRPIMEYEELVKTTTCYVVDLVYNQEQLDIMYKNTINGTNKIITSEKVGDYSRNMSTLSASDLKDLVSSENKEKEITNLINKMLMPTGLLYRGIDVY